MPFPRRSGPSWTVGGGFPDERCQAGGEDGGVVEADTGGAVVSSEWTIPSALTDFQDIERALEGKQAAVFLDYDGTLTPIVDTPEQAVLSEEMRGTVRRLGDRCVTAVVSGRGRQDVQERMRLDNLFYAGTHGFDIVGPAGSGIHHQVGQEFVPVMEELHQRLGGALAQVPACCWSPSAFPWPFTIALWKRRRCRTSRPWSMACCRTIPSSARPMQRRCSRSGPVRLEQGQGGGVDPPGRWGSTTRASCPSILATTPPMKMPSRPWPAREWESLWQTSPARQQRVIDWRATRRWRASSSVLHTPFMNPYNLNPLAARGRTTLVAGTRGRTLPEN